MKESFFKLKNQFTEDILFKKNNNFINKESSVNVDFFSDINIEYINNTSAEVLLKFKVFSEEQFDNSPFFLMISQKGVFEWTNDTPRNTVEQLLNTNAPAVLLSYIRSLISQITAFSGYPTLIVPLINFKK